MNRSRVRWLIALFMAFALVASACGDDDGGSDAAPIDTGETGTDDPAPADPAPDEPDDVKLGGELIVGINTDSPSYYPPNSAWIQAGGLLPSRAMFETFTRRAASGEIKLELAESLEANDDFTVWTMVLRPGITFHDDTALDAAAVVEMHELWKEAPTYQPGVGIDTAVAIDELTIEFTMFSPDPALGDLFSGARGAAFSPTAALEQGAGAANDPVGTGPFVFESWTRDSEISMTANVDYWREDHQPRLDRLVFRFLLDRDARHASLLAGDINVTAEHGGAGLDNVADAGYDVIAGPSDDSRLVIFNTALPPLDDVRVRRSLAHALDPADREALETLLPGKPYSSREQYYGENSPWHVAGATEAYARFDPELAQSLHDEYANDPDRSDGKAVGDPVSLSYMCNSDAELFQEAQFFQATWGAIGYEVELLGIEQNVLIANYIGTPEDPQGPFTGTHLAACSSEQGVGDPATNYKTFYGELSTNVVNWTNYHNDIIQTALDTLATTDDPTARLEAIGAIESDLAAAMPRIYGPETATAVGIETTVRGLEDWTYLDGTPGDPVVAGNLYWPAIYIDEG